MKRLYFICLMFVYLLSTTGVFATIHYCGDKITDWSVVTSHEEICGCGDIETPDCCSDIQIEAKIFSETTPVQSLKLSNSSVCLGILIILYSYPNGRATAFHSLSHFSVIQEDISAFSGEKSMVLRV